MIIKFRKYKYIFSIAIITALLFSVSVPLFHFSLAKSPQQNTEVSSPFSDKILICTSSGYKYISLEDYETGNFPKDYNEKIKCPKCTVNLVAGDKALLSSLAVNISYPLSLKLIYNISFQNILENYSYLNPLSRAPPLYS